MNIEWDRMNKYIILLTFSIILVRVTAVLATCPKANVEDNNNNINGVGLRQYLRTKVDPSYCEEGICKDGLQKVTNNMTNDSIQNVSASQNSPIEKSNDEKRHEEIVQDQPLAKISNISLAENDKSKVIRKRRMNLKPSQKSVCCEDGVCKTSAEMRKSEPDKKSKGIISRLKEKISGKKDVNDNGQKGSPESDDGDVQETKNELVDGNDERCLKYKRNLNLNRDDDMMQNLLINRLSLNEAGTIPPSLKIVKRLHQDPVLMASRRVRSVIWEGQKIIRSDEYY